MHAEAAGCPHLDNRDGSLHGELTPLVVVIANVVAAVLAPQYDVVVSGIVAALLCKRVVLSVDFSKLCAVSLFQSEVAKAIVLIHPVYE